MGDPILIGIRFALYANLMLIAGLAAFLLYALAPDERATPELAGRIWLVEQWLCASGLFFSTVGMGVLAASMQGVSLLDLEVLPFWGLVRQSDVGTAWLYRSAALLVALASSIWIRRWPNAAATLLTAAGIMAIATFAWAGHAGATEDYMGTLHRISDILHMMAAAVWIGAIVAFFLLLHPRCPDWSINPVPIVARSLKHFSVVGTICVVTIVVTGLINSQIIIGFENLDRSLMSPYGLLLLVKLALFALMLALAAANRWRFTPALDAAVVKFEDSADRRPADALASIRKSLTVEAITGFAILGVVAWFGTLEPFEVQ